MKNKFSDIVSEDELTDMFGEGGKEEVKEFYGEIECWDCQKHLEKCKKCQHLVTSPVSQENGTD